MSNRAEVTYLQCNSGHYSQYPFYYILNLALAHHHVEKVERAKTLSRIALCFPFDLMKSSPCFCFSFSRICPLIPYPARQRAQWCPINDKRL